MTLSLPLIPFFLRALRVVLLAACPLVIGAQTLTITDDVQTHATLASGTVATLSGRAELHVTGVGDPIPAATIHLNSPDAWLFFDNIRPSAVVSTLLSRVRVNGAAAVSASNVRVVQFGPGAVVIPHAPTFEPITIFGSRNLAGPSRTLPLHTLHSGASLGGLAGKIRSFRLKRGYMATVATQANGTGISQVYVAQDGDLEVGVLPANLDNAIQFVRVFPWRWVSKKGSCDIAPGILDASWHYNWDNNQTSPLDWEYVPIRQQRWWPGYPNDKQGSTHVLGYNEPNNPVEDAYTSLNNGSVDAAIAAWPELLTSGLRLGSPAVTDGGEAWLYDFMDKADAAKLRVDFVAIHFYRCGYSASALYDWLYNIHVRTGRPLWVTEFNNGANWTGCADPTLAQNATTISAFTDMMDNAPFIERYAIYSNVEDVRKMVDSGGVLTPAGTAYKANASPLAYTSVFPAGSGQPAATYLMDDNLSDASGNGNHGTLVGAPVFVPGRVGQAIRLDGATDHVRLPAGLGDSGDFTFAAWVFWNSGANWQRIFDFGNGTAEYLFLTPGSGTSTLRFGIKANGVEQVLDTTRLATGQWVHVAVTLGGGIGRIYVNGVQAASGAMTLKPTDIVPVINYLGKSQWSSDPLFNGSLDEVRILGTAASAAQIAAWHASAAASPAFSSSALTVADATVGMPYAADIASLATDATPGDTLTFAKIGGPAWLTIATDGALTGVPGAADMGLNTCVVRVTDLSGATDLATLTLTVVPSALGGLLQRYPFDNSLLARVGGAHATATGSPTFLAGRHLLAIRLDGVDDYLTLPAGVANTSALTIATWVYWNGGASWQRIFDFGAGTTKYMFLTPGSGSGTLRFGIRNAGVEQALDTGASLPTGQWVHVALTLGDGVGRLYVNGAQAATGAITFTPADLSATLNYIGKSQWSADPLFTGNLDDFLIYNQALSAAQIAAIHTNTPPAFSSITKPGATAGYVYHASIAGSVNDPGDTQTYMKVGGPAWLAIAPDGTLSGTPGAADAGVNKFAVRVVDSSLGVNEITFTLTVSGGAGPTARYLFDANVQDGAGILHGAATGAPAYTTGFFDQALVLDGADDYVTLPAAVSVLTDFTFATRVRWDAAGDVRRILDFTNGITLSLAPVPGSASGSLRAAFRSAGLEQVLEVATPSAGDWAHVALTREGGIGRLYLDGILAATGPVAETTASAAAGALNYIGRGNLQPYARDAATLHLWHLDETSAPAVDAVATGAVNLTTLANGAMLGQAALGGFGTALSTAANRGLSTAAYLAPAVITSAATTDNVPIQLAGADGAFTFEALVRVDFDPLLVQASGGASGGMQILSAEDDGAARVFQFRLMPRGTNNAGAAPLLQFLNLRGGSAVQTIEAAIPISGNEAILQGAWYHVAVSYNGRPAATGNFKFYWTRVGSGFRARAAELRSASLTNPLLAGPGVFCVGNEGRASNGTGENFVGLIDEVRISSVARAASDFLFQPLFDGAIDDLRIYPRALSATEIGDLASPHLALTSSLLAFDTWAAIEGLTTGQNGVADDPDQDGAPNLLEYVLGADPLLADASGILPPTELLSAETLGLAANGKHHLTLTVRARKDRAGVTLVPEGATSVEALAAPEAAANVTQAGAPASDGDFDVFIYYLSVAIEDSPTGRSFLRLRVVKE